MYLCDEVNIGNALVDGLSLFRKTVKQSIIYMGIMAFFYLFLSYIFSSNTGFHFIIFTVLSIIASVQLLVKIKSLILHENKSTKEVVTEILHYSMLCLASAAIMFIITFIVNILFVLILRVTFSLSPALAIMQLLLMGVLAIGLIFFYICIVLGDQGVFQTLGLTIKIINENLLKISGVAILILILNVVINKILEFLNINSIILYTFIYVLVQVLLIHFLAVMFYQVTNLNYVKKKEAS